MVELGWSDGDFDEFEDDSLTKVYDALRQMEEYSAQKVDVSEATILENGENLDKAFLQRIAGPSTNKAGLEKVDKEKISQLIYEISKVLYT